MRIHQLVEGMSLPGRHDRPLAVSRLIRRIKELGSDAVPYCGSFAFEDECGWYTVEVNDKGKFGLILEELKEAGYRVDRAIATGGGTFVDLPLVGKDLFEDALIAANADGDNYPFGTRHFLASTITIRTHRMYDQKDNIITPKGNGSTRVRFRVVLNFPEHHKVFFPRSTGH